MKVNKTILFGIILILFAVVIFITDFLNPLIRPITYLFLMGSSKGKDIIFFGLFGLFIILSQLVNRDIDSKKYLKISIILGSILLISGIVLEVIFRLNLGIGINTVFCSMSNSMSSTSILHTHLLKSILGEVISQIIDPSVGSGINTGVGLYEFIPKSSFLVMILFPILFITIVLSLQKRSWPVQLLISFFASCLFIGALDGGLFATPSMLGIFGLFLVYRNDYYLNLGFGILFTDSKLIKKNEKNKAFYYKFPRRKYFYTRFLPYIIIFLLIFLRIGVGMAGSEVDYYTVEIKDIGDNVDFGDIPIKHINNTIYHVNSSYNEIKLINDLKVALNNSCEYYTVSWNTYSYF